MPKLLMNKSTMLKNRTWHDRDFEAQNCLIIAVWYFTYVLLPCDSLYFTPVDIGITCVNSRTKSLKMTGSIQDGTVLLNICNRKILFLSKKKPTSWTGLRSKW